MTPGAPHPRVLTGGLTPRRLGASSFRQSVGNWRQLCAALAAADLRTEVWHASCGVELEGAGGV